MRKHPSSMMAVLAILMLIMAACTTPAASESPEASEPAASEPAASEPAMSEAPTADYKACMVSDVGGIDDNSFNENAWAGMERAQAELGVEVTFLESRSAEDYARNIDQHVADGCDMIVTVGFLLGDATRRRPRRTRTRASRSSTSPMTRPSRTSRAWCTPRPRAAMLAGYCVGIVVDDRHRRHLRRHQHRPPA